MDMNHKPDNIEAIEQIKKSTESENIDIGENAKIDAIIISKVSDRQKIELIDPLDISLKCYSTIGNISNQVLKKHSPVAYLTPLFLKLTLISRMANVNLGAVLDSENFKKSELVVGCDKIAVQLLSHSIFEISNSAFDLKRYYKGLTDNSESRDELFEALSDSAYNNVFMVLKCIEQLCKSNKSSILHVQKNTIKHINQLVKLI